MVVKLIHTAGWWCSWVYVGKTHQERGSRRGRGRLAHCYQHADQRQHPDVWRGGVGVEGNYGCFWHY